MIEEADASKEMTESQKLDLVATKESPAAQKLVNTTKELTEITQKLDHLANILEPSHGREERDGAAPNASVEGVASAGLELTPCSSVPACEDNDGWCRLHQGCLPLDSCACASDVGLVPLCAGSGEIPIEVDCLRQAE